MKHPRSSPDRRQGGTRNQRPQRAWLRGRLPETTVVHISGIDPDGDALARPAAWDAADGPPPVIFMRPELPGRPALAPGERVWRG